MHNVCVNPRCERHRSRRTTSARVARADSTAGLVMCGVRRIRRFHDPRGRRATLPRLRRPRPSGVPAVGRCRTDRRAKKASGLSAVVVRWARARKRYERQGILVEEDALATAEEHCLADADARERRRERERERRDREDVVFRDDLSAAIVRLFPRCPANRAAAIAAHAGARGVGGSGEPRPVGGSMRRQSRWPCVPRSVTSTPTTTSC